MIGRSPRNLQEFHHNLLKVLRWQEPSLPVASKEINSDVKVLIVRPTAVYGRWDYSAHVIPSLIKRVLKKENPFIVWGTGEEVRDLLYITDFARGCLLMMEKWENSEPVNIGFGKGIKIKDVVKIILKAANHQDAEVKFDTAKPTAIPKRLVDVTRAEKLLGFKPEISLEKGIKDTVEWFKQNMDQDIKLPEINK